VTPDGLRRYISIVGGTGPTGPAGVNGSGGSGVVNLTAALVPLSDNTDFTIVEAIPNITEGTGYVLEIIPTTAIGLLLIVLYQDAARLDVVYSMYVDLSDATTYRSSEVYGFQLETVGTLYATAFVSGVGLGETFDVHLTAAGLALSITPTPLSTPYGQGIENDGNGLPRIALASGSGLNFDINNKLIIAPDLTATVYPVLSAAGVAIAGAIDTSTTQEVAAKKNFDAVGLTLLAAIGPPTAGTYLQGMEILDVNGIKWRCTVGGTPGLWELVDSVYEELGLVTIGTLSYGDSISVGIQVTGNVGHIQRLQVFGVPDGVTNVGNYSVPFRVRVYPTASLFGRELIWQGNGFARNTYLSSSLAAGLTAVPVNDNNVADIDEAVVFFEGYGGSTDVRFELARIVARPTGEFTIDEALIDEDSWVADTWVCVASEWVNVPFVNTTPVPEDQYLINLQVRHDGLSTDPDITFYAIATIFNQGIIR
jgi:hypothetical protein